MDPAAMREALALYAEQVVPEVMSRTRAARAGDGP
jgi:hypothetical protein